MPLEPEDGMTERNGGFAVAGVARNGSDIDVDALWEAYDDYAADLDRVGVGEDRFGVLFDLDGDSEDYTYVAGVEVDSPEGLAPELTVVEIPETSYAVFRPSGDAVHSVVDAITDREFGVDEHETGPMFERYAPVDDPTSPDIPLEFYVPVRET